MAIALGKRKRRADLDQPTVPSLADQQSQRMQVLLQKHFESAFEPLSNGILVTAEPEQVASVGSEESEDAGGWSGFSDVEGSDATVEIVDHSASPGSSDTTSKEERKRFMDSKPRYLLDEPQTQKTKPSKKTEDSSVEASLLKNDLALQRLLQESHLLESSSLNSLSVSGKARHKALDLRLQALGSKSSTLTQKSMPMTHRKGIQDKKRHKEDTRRSEARENGIILEKERKDTKKAAKRERSIGGPSVGRFKGGTLHLSRKDLSDIQGPTKLTRKNSKGSKRRR